MILCVPEQLTDGIFVPSSAFITSEIKYASENYLKTSGRKVKKSTDIFMEPYIKGIKSTEGKRGIA